MFEKCKDFQVRITSNFNRHKMWTQKDAWRTFFEVNLMKNIIGIVAEKFDALAIRIHVLAQTSFVIHKSTVYNPLVLKAYETSEEL